MGKTFRVGSREANLLNKIESSKERDRIRSINAVRDNIEMFSNKVAMKLVENKLVETLSKNSLQKQIEKCMEIMCRAEDFDINYQISPFRTLVRNPNVVSLYLTAFIVETLINHRDTIDIYGSDEDIYYCIQTVTSQLMSGKTLDS